MAAKARNYCFTSFLQFGAECGLELKLPKYEDGVMRYLCWGEEVCPDTHKEHVQGYVEFLNPVSVRSAQRLLGLPRCHLERRRGSAKQARVYCQKEGAFCEFGTISKQGGRTDLGDVRAAIQAGLGMRGVIRSDANYQGLRYGEKYLTYLEPGTRESPPEVLWYHGATGTGKTRAALAEATERFPDDVWWANGELD